jgi:hypothetical protein
MRKTQLMFIFFTVAILFMIPIENVHGETTKKDIDIATSPHKVLFDINNMNPGDWAIRDLHVQNKGKKDFKYTTSIHFKSGSKQLYNALALNVSDKNGKLYSGVLADFNGLDYRTLAKADKETLTFRIEVPEELGNEFQGLDCKFTIKLYVEGTLGGLLPASATTLPIIGTNILDYIGGFILFLGGSTFYFFKR